MKCDKCDLIFENEDLLKTHKHYHCQVIPLHFATAKSDELDTHDINTNLKCDIGLCQLEFPSVEDLVNHIQVKHKDIFKDLSAIHSCEECKSSFKTKSTFLLHMSEHHSPKMCQQCELTFPSKQDLKHHMHEIHLKCIVCQISCGSLKELKNHKKTAHKNSNVVYKQFTPVHAP